MAYQNDRLDELILMKQVWSDLANENQFFDQKCNFNIKQANILKKNVSRLFKKARVWAKLAQRARVTPFFKKAWAILFG